jgi:hypothetical protein
MSIGVKTRKMLWGRAANRCSFPDCKIDLVMDETETDDESIIGDEAHIIAQEPDGPRGDPNFPKDQIDKYNNLILLCKIHHKLVDDQFVNYSVDVLYDMKKNHITWVKDKLDYDDSKQVEDEIYASYLEIFIKMADVEDWEGWMSNIYCGSTTSMRKTHYDNLKELNTYLLNRVWPKRYLKLEESFLNIRLVINDLLRVFDKYKIDTNESDTWRTEKFYKIREYDQERYHMLAKKFDYHEDLVKDLCCELTKATNHLFNNVRKFLLRSFRINEGVLLITTGPHFDLSYKTYRLEYTEEELNTLPYKGLKEFMKIRDSRSLSFGGGIREDYFPPEF